MEIQPTSSLQHLLSLCAEPFKLSFLVFFHDPIFNPSAQFADVAANGSVLDCHGLTVTSSDKSSRCLVGGG